MRQWNNRAPKRRYTITNMERSRKYVKKQKGMEKSVIQKVTK